jgi:hypothetical protein
MDIGYFMIGIRDNNIVDLRTLVKRIILNEEIRIFGLSCRVYPNDAYKVNEVMLTLSTYCENVMRRCHLELGDQYTIKLLGVMRCVILLYILILKIGYPNIQFMRNIPDSYNKKTHDTPIVARAEIIDNDLKCTKFLNVYVVENYICKMVDSFAMNLYDLAGVQEYITRLLRLPQRKLCKYDRALYSSLLPAIIIVHRKACMSDIPYYNSAYTKKCTVNLNDLMELEACLIADINLFTDENIYIKICSHHTKELNLIKCLL